MNLGANAPRAHQDRARTGHVIAPANAGLSWIRRHEHQRQAWEIPSWVLPGEGAFVVVDPHPSNPLAQSRRSRRSRRWLQS